MSKCWKQEKSSWKRDGSFQPKIARSGCTGLSGGALDSVRWCTGQCPVRQAGDCQLAALGKQLTAYGYKSPDRPVEHRTIRLTVGSPDSPVIYSSTPLIASREQPADRLRPGAPDTVWCTTGHCPVHHRTVRCTQTELSLAERSHLFSNLTSPLSST